MSTFEKVRIKELGRIITGNTPVSTDETNYGGKYPFIKPTDMVIDQKHVFEHDETYSEKSYQRFIRSYIPKGATGVVTIGTVGEKMFQAHEDCFTNQSVNCIISDDKYFDKDYIYYLMKFNLPKVKGANPGTASGRHHVSKSNFSSIKIDVTKNLKTQQKIAKILSNYDDLIENNLKRIKLLEESARLTYEEWFLRFRIDGKKLEIDPETKLPFGWKWKLLKDFGEVVTGKTPSTNNEDFYGGDIPFVKTPSMHGNTYTLETEEYLTDLGVNTQQNKFLPKNSLMVSCIGTAGVYSLVANDCQTNQQINSIKFHKDEYIFYVYGFAGHLSNILDAIGSNGATMTNVNKTKFENIEVAMPSSELLERFHNTFSPNFESILNIMRQNQLLKEARDILLPRLMTNVIDTNDMDIAI